MRKIISILLAVCLVLTAFPLIAAAGSPDRPAALQRKVFFADYAGQFNGAYLYGWEIQGGYFIDTPYEWPGVMMEAVDANDKGDVMYAAVMPYNINYVIISDINGNQTVEIPLGERMLISLNGEVDENLYYQVNVEEIPCDEQNPTLPDDGAIHPTIPTEAHTVEENLIVLNNTLDMFAEDIYICCRSGEKNGEGATLRTKMEHFDTNGYGEGMYRFTMPEGMNYYYFIDNKKRTEELACNPNLISAHLYMTGYINYNGEYRLSHIFWSGGYDTAFTQGQSRTLFDRFQEVYNPDHAAVTALLSRYDELYEHCGSNGDTDWVLFRVEMNGDPGMLAMYKGVIGNRVVDHGAYFDAPFPSYYVLYDAARDVFVPVDGSMTDDYDGLAQAFDKVGEGRLLGDIDNDDAVSVLDTTIIQRCEAKITDYPSDDETSVVYHDHVIWYYSDFNRDGERGVLDATCIQRYLAGISYPMG